MTTELEPRRLGPLDEGGIVTEVTPHVCDGINKVIPMIEAKDWGRLIGASLHSADEYCRCDRPILNGFDLMCACCLHRNEGQIEKRTAAMRAPHEFEVRIPGDSLDKIGMCSFCSRWREDRSHAALSQEGEAG